MRLQRQRFESTDDVRPFVDKGRIEIVDLDGVQVGRATFEPGWRWSEHVGALTGRTSCPMTHVGYVLSGRQRLQMDDGDEVEVGPGDLVTIPPGHDGWTVGDEPCVILYFGDLGDYARPT